MPWVPRKDALRQRREAAGLSIYELAAKVGISERQIRTIESDTPPGSIYPKTIQSLADVLRCEKTALATWVARKGDAPAPATQGQRSQLPDGTPKTLEELAAMERNSRLAGVAASRFTETSDGVLEWLGAERLVEINAQFGAFEGEPFLVCGIVGQHQPLPPETAQMLGIESGVGGLFEITHALLYDVPFGVTVLSPGAEITRYLLDLRRDEVAAELLVRVIVQRPKESWLGFVGLEADAQPLPYALWVEGAVTANFPWRTPAEGSDDPTS
jgi:transcriptional regulator with XRE-family HTH domain